MPLDFDEDPLGGPRYQQLARALINAISHGAFAASGKLPTERSLATELGISRSTVVAAYGLLEREGIVVRRQGSGTWLGPEATLRPAVTKFGPTVRAAGEMISFRLANLPAADVLRDAIDKIRGDVLDAELATQGYASHGLPSLRQRIASYYTDAGLITRPEQILVTTGAQQAIALAASVLVGEGQTVVVDDPTYSGALEAFHTRTARVLAVPPEGLHVDSAVLRPHPDRLPPVIYVMPVQNPTGSVLTTEARDRIVRIATERPVLVLEDRTLANITLNGPAPPPIACDVPADRVLVIESLSKVVWGGLRVGWVRASEELIESLARRKALFDLASPVLSQLVAAEVLPQVKEVAASAQQRARERLDMLTSALAELLPSWSWVEPAGGLSLWVKLPKGVASEFLQIAIQHGVTAVDGSSMSPSSKYRDYVRLPYVHERPLLMEGIERLAQAWRSYESVPEHHTSFTLVT